MEVRAFSTELGIRLSFVKTSEFRGWGWFEPPNPLRYATAYWRRRSRFEGRIKMCSEEKGFDCVV
jgi:hypothetical protein